MKKILIVTHPEDLHAHLVAEALHRKGALAVLWHTSDYPNHATETVSFVNGEPAISVDGVGVGEEELDFDAVWMRRPEYMWGEQIVHDADVRFTDLQCSCFRDGLLQLLSPGAFWVNPPDTTRRLRSKLYQHAEAAAAGLEMPESLYTNDPDAIRAFLARHGRIVYKSLHPLVWQEGDESWGVFTTELSESKLVADHLLQAVPGIYQELVPKDHELRVTAIGDRFFAAKVPSQETTFGRVDWRLAYEELTLERTALGAEVEAKCRALMRRLGIVFGCFDLIVTPDGEYVFLEVNHAGQFTFVERACGLPLIDAMCELLIQGRASYDWNEEEVEIRLDDVDEIALNRRTEAIAEHPKRLRNTLVERVADIEHGTA